MRVARYAIVFIAVSLLLLFGVYFLFKGGYKRYHAVEVAQLDDKLNGTAYHDLLFLGSSRTYVQINPKVIDSVTKLNSYNAGIAGAKFIEMNMILECYLAKRKPPKAIIIDVPSAGFDANQRPFFNPSIYFSFLNNETVYKTLSDYQKTFLLKYIPFSQLTEADDDMRQGALLGWLGKRFVKQEQCYKGYMQNGHDTLELPFRQTYFNLAALIAASAVNGLLKIIETCKRNKIQVILFYPPVYREIQEQPNPEFFPTVNEIATANEIPFLNYWELPLGKNHRLFTDQIHLNVTGSDIFSAILASDIVKELNANAQITNNLTHK